MDDEYERDLRWIIRICNDEIMSVYCSSDGKFSVTQNFLGDENTLETEVVE